MNATISNNNSTECIRDTRVTAVVLPCIYGILFVLALALNSLAAWIFFTIPANSTSRVYLKNVVVADLLMIVTIPVRVLEDVGVGSWRLRAFYCRYSSVLFYLSMNITIPFLGLISLDRYLKIVRPFGNCALQKVRVGQVLSATVWVVMLSLALPNTILADKPPPQSVVKFKCTSLKNKLGLIWYEGSAYFVQVLFWGTLTLMVVCYSSIARTVYKSYKASRSSSGATSRRTKANVFVVVAVFFICFAPFYIALVPYSLSQTRNTAIHDCSSENAIFIVKETTLWLSTTNVCLDPLIHIFLCKMFRRQLRAILSRKPCSKGTIDMAPSPVAFTGVRDVIEVVHMHKVKGKSNGEVTWQRELNAV